MSKADVVEQTERQFADAVVELAQLLGWEVKRDPTWRATAASPGYPDLTLAHANQRRIIFAELKTDKGRITSEQHRWLDTLDEAAYESVERCNVSAVVWRPRDWPEIELALKGEGCARCMYTERLEARA